MVSLLAPAVALASAGDITVEPALDVPATARALETRTPFRLAEGLSLDPASRLAPAELRELDRIREMEDWNLSGALPMKNGFARSLPHPLLASLRDSDLTSTPVFAQGGWRMRSIDDWVIWGTSIQVEGAWRVRLKLDRIRLPQGTRFWVWAPDSEPISFGLELMNLDSELWTPTTEGELIYLEVAFPAPPPEPQTEPYFRIEELMELFPVRAPESAECLIDATCVTSGTLDVIASVRNAIAHMQYVKGSSSYVCSGGLLNDTVTTSIIPYFLTANHCISTQSVASTLEAYWDYRSSTCGGVWPNIATLPRSNGATLLATSLQTDFAFLKLNSIPSGRTLLGWTTGAVADGATLHRVSHPYPLAFPVPAPQAYSSTFNDFTPTYSCSSDSDGRPLGDLSKFLHSSASVGGTYGGSSGSPVILAGGYVVGQLYGACGSNNEGCSSLHDTIDGRFSATYPAIQQYLNPNSGTSPCIPGSNTACLLGGRFKVEIEWTDFSNVTRTAFVASAGTPDSALFYWTNVNNWEVLIKAINACSLNSKFWIYFAAATNVGYRVTVTDTVAGGAPKVYSNPLGNLAQATNDINAFSCP